MIVLPRWSLPGHPARDVGRCGTLCGMASATDLTDAHPILGLTTDAEQWADLFVEDHPDTGIDRETFVAWFDACISTSKTMAVASLPLPSRFR